MDLPAPAVTPELAVIWKGNGSDRWDLIGFYDTVEAAASAQEQAGADNVGGGCAQIVTLSAIGQMNFDYQPDDLSEEAAAKLRERTRHWRAIEYLRQYAAAGFPKRADGSFPTDFLTAMRIIAQIPDSVSSRALEEALAGIPDGDHRLKHWRFSAKTDAAKFDRPSTGDDLNL